VSGDMQPVGEDDLHAWVDDQLSPERREDVERWFERNPDEASRFRAYRAHRDQLRKLFAPKADEAVPASLCPETLLAARRQLWQRRLRNIAASIVLLFAGGMVGWIARGPVAQSSAQLAADAVQAHLTFVKEVRHPVEVPAAQEAHLVTWLSNRLGRPLRVPDLSSFGFHLIGGRLLPSEQVPAAQFMFEDDRGMRLTLYLRQESQTETGFDVVERDGIAGFRWFEDGFGYVVLAPVGRERLLKMAEAIYRQLPGGTRANSGF
jgi:anti-sigma factor RsiW